MNILGCIFFIHNCDNMLCDNIRPEYGLISKIYGINHVLNCFPKRLY